MALTLMSILILTTCQKPDLGLRFKMEKMLSEADHLADRIRQQSQRVSDDDLRKLVDAYSKISSMLPPPNNSAEVSNASAERQQAWALASLATTRVGTLYMENKMFERAYEGFKSVAENPATSALQRNAVKDYMAMALEQLKRYPEAAALYDTVAADYPSLIVPDNPNMDALEAPIKSARMWNSAGNNAKYLDGMDKAREYYGGLASEFKGSLMESAAYGKIAASYIEQQKFPQAISALRSVPADTSGHTSPAILLMIADLYMNNMRDYIGAENTYREFAQYYPKHPKIASATLGIGLSLYEQGKYSEARKAVDDIYRIPGADQKSVAQSYYLTGLCYENEDKWDFAKGEFDLVEASFPSSDEAFEAVLYVANHYRTAGNKELTQKAYGDAVEFINKIIVLNRTNPIDCARAEGYLVRAYTENGDIAKATDELIRLHQTYPLLPEGKLAPLRLADINENITHDTQKAIDWLKTYLRENPDAPNIDGIQTHIKALEAHLNQ